MADAEKKRKISLSSEHGLMKKAVGISKSKKVFGEGLLSKTEKYSRKLGSNQKVIVEKDGLFMIKEGVETSSVVQDPVLKKLVDSVLR